MFLALSVFIPSVNRGIRTIARRPSEFVWEHISSHRRHLWYVGFSLLAVLLFWVCRSRTYLLGDGFFLVSDLDRGGETWVWSELAESLVYFQLHKFLNLFLLADGHLTYQIGSVVAGAVFIFLAFLLSDNLGRDLFDKIFVFIILSTMGTMQLFFGYSEHYSYVSVAVLAYILWSLRWLEKRGRIVVPVFLFLLCAALHFSSFFLLPSLVYLLLLAGPRRTTAKRVLILLGGVLVALALVSVYVYSSKPLLIRIFVLPFEGTFTAGYTAFSSAHLLDIVNELLLLSPAGVILILASLLTSFRDADIGSPRISFLMLAAGFGFVFHFTFDPELGAARDWDMFAITSLGYTVLGVCLLLNLSGKSESLKYASLIVVCTSVLSLVPWITLNCSEAKSVRRYRDVLELDPLKSRTGHFTLTDYFGKRGMWKEVEEEIQRQYEIYPHLRLALQAMEYYDKGMPDTALHLLREAQELDPYSSEVHYYLGKIHRLQGNLDSAELEYKKTLELKPEHVNAGLDLAVTYMYQQRWDKALSQYKKVLKFRKKDPEVYYNMGVIHLHQNRSGEALEYFRKAIDISDNFLLARCGLAVALSRTGRKDEAAEELENLIQSKPDIAEAYFQLGYLYRDRGEIGKAITSWEQFLRLSKDPRRSEIITDALDSLQKR